MAITLRAARTNCGLTQDEMAQKLGMSINGYLKLEHDSTNMKMATAKKFCEITGFAIDALFFGPEIDL